MLRHYSNGFKAESAHKKEQRERRNVTITLRASFSGTFLQTLPELVTPLKGNSFITAQLSIPTPSAPSERFGYWSRSERRFPAPSSKFCQIWLRHWRGTLYLRSCPPTRSASSERFGYYDCGSSLAPKHPRKHEAHPPRVKKRKKVPSRFKRFWFYLSRRKQHCQL